MQITFSPEIQWCGLQRGASSLSGSAPASNRQVGFRGSWHRLACTKIEFVDCCFWKPMMMRPMLCLQAGSDGRSPSDDLDYLGDIDAGLCLQV